MRDVLPGLVLRAGAMCGALLVVAAVVGVPGGARADVACRDDDGWWCLYGKPNLRDGGGLIGTNNPDTDLKMDGDWWGFNDATRSVSNRTDSYVGLYDDIEFQGMMACLPPGTWVKEIHAGVSSLRIHPGRAEACTGSGEAARPLPLRVGPDAEPTPKKRSRGGEVSATPSATPTDAGASATPSASPELDLPPLVAKPSRQPGTANRSASGSDGFPWGIAAAVIALLVLAGLGITGWVYGRRLRDVRAPRTAADPGAVYRVHGALMSLAAGCEREARDVPKVRAVTIDATEVTLHLATGDPHAPRPWRVAPDGRSWRLFVIDIGGLAGGADTAAPYPLLAMVRPGMWVNLAAFPGPIALAGHRNAARKAAVELARRLRESPWREGVRIRMLGFETEAPMEPETGPERGRVVFINDGMRVPAKTPPGSAVVAVGRPDGAGTTWRVRFDGSIAPPAGVPARPPAPAPVGSGADSADPADAGGGE